MAHVAKRQIDLALQGGGSHGAFTWGVIDRLLEDRDIVIAGISGTSAGAMNAVVLAAGLMEGGRDGARDALRRFWTGVSAISGRNPLLDSALGAFFGNWSLTQSPFHAYLNLLGQSLSPYQFNPFNFNPLHDVLRDVVDFDTVRHCDKIRVFISATNVRSGALKIFRNADIGIDAVMASACLPMLFQAVVIDGEAYWDGGYVGNPALEPLIAESPAHDLMIVQINPTLRDDVPNRTPEIIDRINEISFNSSLLREIHSIALLKQLIETEGHPPGPACKQPVLQRVDTLRLHHIHGDSDLVELGASSKLNTGWHFLSSLFDIGRSTADAWLNYHRKSIGRRSSLDLSAYLQ